MPEYFDRNTSGAFFKALGTSREECGGIRERVKGNCAFQEDWEKYQDAFGKQTDGEFHRVHQAMGDIAEGLLAKTLDTVDGRRLSNETRNNILDVLQKFKDGSLFDLDIKSHEFQMNLMSLRSRPAAVALGRLVRRIANIVREPGEDNLALPWINENGFGLLYNRSRPHFKEDGIKSAPPKCVEDARIWKEKYGLGQNEYARRDS